MDDLLAAIIAAPDDDAPRMVYADKLSEAGDPLGELISLQLAIAKVDAADDAIAPELLAREKQLRTEIKPRELIGLVPSTFEYRRGFVEHVTITRSVELAFEPMLSVITRAPLLRSIALPGTAIGKPLTDEWSRFESITLNEPVYLSEDQVREFAKSPAIAKLKRLHLINANFSNRIVDALLELAAPLVTFGITIPRNYTIDLRREMVLDRIAAKGWALESLFVAGIDIASLAPLAGMPLRHLALHDCDMREATLVKVADQFPELITLEVDGSSDIPTRVLEAFPKLRRLRWRSDRPEGVAKAIAKSPKFGQLRRLDVGKLVEECLADHILAAVYERPRVAWPEEMMTFMHARQKISAIKEHREHCGAGLLESKLCVERVMEEYGIDSPPHPSTTTWLAL